MAKESSITLARLASKIIKGGSYTDADVKRLAASVLTQYEKKPVKKPAKRKTSKPSS